MILLYSTPYCYLRPDPGSLHSPEIATPHYHSARNDANSSLSTLHFLLSTLIPMLPQEQEQIKNLISNFESSREHIPYLRELEAHPAFGPVFQSFSDEEKDAANLVIKEYIEEKIASLKTK